MAREEEKLNNNPIKAKEMAIEFDGKDYFGIKFFMWGKKINKGYHQSSVSIIYLVNTNKINKEERELLLFLNICEIYSRNKVSFIVLVFNIGVSSCCISAK